MRLLAIAIVSGIVVGMAALVWRSAPVVKARDSFYLNRVCCDLSLPRALTVTFHEEVGGRRFPSQLGQDKWVIFRMFPGVNGGFFVDVGSADGTSNSNSKALEERGWKGVCIDPFPTNMSDRTCQMFKEVVWSVPGHTVRFHTQGELGGIADTLGSTWKKEAMAAPVVELQTVTLADILARANAPSYIHFMSLDIEGAELEALRGLPFDKYRFGAIAIEHNEEEPKRTEVLNYLAARGYARVHTRLWDDFFAPKEQ
jgi:FkbM family methyltransferase